MQCLDDNLVVRFAERLLSPDVLPVIRAHLDECATCRRSVAAAARVLHKPEDLSLGEDDATLVRKVTRGSHVGRYMVLERLGAGGMGVVFSAYDPDLDRKVALKLLHGRAESEGAGARLIAEAKALARIAHPHVVAVHDAGIDDGLAFVAMELVHGVSLSHWLKERRRSRREVLAVLLKAGAGLAAAHRAGIVHLDFKPENVLVDEEDRPRVTDFGLARVTAGAAGAPASCGETDVTLPTTTRAVPFAGTPVYASPEQLSGEAVDARADQFSFCTTLWEALLGERPFKTVDLKDLRAAMARGPIREALSREANAGPCAPSVKATRRAVSEARRLPLWLLRALEKGLAVQPSDRFPTMAALLAALAKDPWPRRRRTIIAVAVAGALMASVPGYRELLHRRPPLCSPAETLAVTVWNPAQQEAAHHAFGATGLAGAESAFTATDFALQRYLGQWRAHYESSCRSLERARDTPREPPLLAEVSCLERRLLDVKARTDLFSEADRGVVDSAVRATALLLPLETCHVQGRRVVEAQSPASADVDAIKAQAVRVHALLDVGQQQAGLNAARQAVERSRILGSEVAEARALYARGEAEVNLDLLDDGEKTLAQAAVLAEKVQDDELATQAYLELVSLTGSWRPKPERVSLYIGLAEASIARLANPDYFRALLLQAKARYHVDTLGDFDAGIAELQESVHLLRLSVGNDLVEVAEALSLAGTLSAGKGLAAQDVTYQKEALAIGQRVLGPEHLEVANYWNNLAFAYAEASSFDQAREAYEHAFAIRERILGPDATLTALTLGRLGMVLGMQGHDEEALSRIEEALHRVQGLVEAKDRRVESLLTLAGSCRRRLGRPRAARQALEQAIAIAEAAGGTTGANAMLELALLELSVGSGAEALRWAARGEKSPTISPGLRAQLRAVRGRAEWSMGRHPPASLALILESRERLAQAVVDEPHLSDRLAELDAWLAEHRFRPEGSTPQKARPASAKERQP